MKRVTITFGDERLYRELQTEAAKEGRPIEDVVAEALAAWLHNRGGLSPTQRTRRSMALQALDEIRSQQPVRSTVEEILSEIRDESA